MNNEDAQIRAARAQQLLEDETLHEVLATLMDDAVLNATLAPLDDPARCVAAVATLQAVREFEDKLRSFVTSGRAAQRKPHVVA